MKYKVRWTEVRWLETELEDETEDGALEWLASREGRDWLAEWARDGATVLDAEDEGDYVLIPV